VQWWWPTQLDRIEAKLDLVLRLERKIMADEAALNEAIAELATAVDQIVAKVSESDVDLTDEVAAIQEITGRIGAALVAPSTEE
jgi:septal ring factor EnvC (AmiA/AmiB activator)